MSVASQFKILANRPAYAIRRMQYVISAGAVP